MSLTRFCTVFSFIVGSLCSCGVHPDSEARRSSEAAFQTVKALVKAERLFFVKHRRYGQIAELLTGSGGVVTDEFGYGQMNGYIYELHVNGDRLSITAKPINVGRTGFFAYFADETGVIRARPGNGRATRDDRAVWTSSP